jgi:FdhE protein
VAVAADIFRKLFSRKPTLPAEVEEARAELKRLAEDRPVIVDLAGQLADCLLGLYSEPIRAGTPPLTNQTAAEKLSAGVPLLRGETLDVDWAVVKRCLIEVVGALAQRRPDAAPALAEAIRSHKLDVADLASAVMNGELASIYERADALNLDVPLTASVLSLALSPVLIPIGAGLKSFHSAGWEHGYCPVCGSFAKLGEFRGLEQIRFLRCGLCTAEWTFPRLHCSCCGNSDHHQLGYLSIEGEENKWRAVTCEVCRQYVKMISTLSPLSPLQLPVKDVETIHLDLLAADHGFTPPM